MESSKCLRCGNEYDNPYPEPSGQGKSNTDIACVEWCAKCNAIVMSALYREASAYFIRGGRPPWQHEVKGGDVKPNSDTLDNES